jgi:predicted N-acetyltransferase YhbS
MGAGVSGFRIREATPADAPGVRRLFRRVFERELTAEEWSWKFEENPDGWYGVVALVGDEIVGNYAGWGTQLVLDGRPALCYSVGDVATDPSVRGIGGRRGIYRSMTEAFYEEVRSRGIPFCYGFPNPRALAISNAIAGTRTLFPIREIHVPCAAFSAPPPDAGAGDFVGESFDALREAALRVTTHGAVRDRARANWRFHARPARWYRMVWSEAGGEALGWAVLSVSGETALVADFLGREADGSDLPALFAAAAAEATRLGASGLVFWETPGGPARDFLRALPGERRDAGFPFVARTFDDAAVERFVRNAHLVPSLYDLV